MREAEVFVLAEYGLKHVIDQIKDDQWSLEVPEGMKWGGGVHSLRDLVSHHARDDAWVPDALAGKTMAEVGATYDGDLLGADPKASFTQIVETAVAAVQDFTDANKTVHLSYGDYPAHQYLLHITIFRGLEAYDLAKFIGADTKLPADLVQGLWDLILPHAGALREMGVFGPEIPVPAEASLQDRLLGLTGRDPAK